MSTSSLTALVHRIRPEASSIVSVELLPASEHMRLPGFSAGSHIDLHMPNGITRSYSLCNDPREQDRYVVAVAHDRHSRGGSRYINQELRTGAELRISAPRNNFRLDEDADRFVLLAGGIGVTPLYAMLQRLKRLGKQVTFIYCARSRGEAAFVDEIAAMADTRTTIVRHFDDEAGQPPSLDTLLAGCGAATRLYCCGPAPMLDAFVATCESLGLPHAFIERFTTARTETPAGDHPYVLELRRSGRVLQVPAGKTPLRAMLEAGIEVDFGCEEGLCGACESRVLEGVVEHRDALLSKAEKASNKTMLICVSGCKTERLVLDL